jgi:tRNA (cmo5U34)-methyltransferase
VGSVLTFDEERARNYERSIRTAGLGYDLLHDLTAALLCSVLGERAHLLVVGAGGGEEIVRLGDRHPGWRFSGVDSSPPMLAIARKRVTAAGLADRVTLLAGHVADLPSDELFAAATLLLVMHFLPDDGAKLALLRETARRLQPGAPLVLADLHGDLTSGAGQRLSAAWRERQRTHGMSTDDITEMFRQLTAHVYFVPTTRINALLREAGFGDITPFFQALLFGGWIARAAA